MAETGELHHLKTLRIQTLKHYILHGLKQYILHGLPMDNQTTPSMHLVVKENWLDNMNEDRHVTLEH